ncbi:MAG: FAD binding domain-containing protein [Acidimicrobiia bacterium]
MTLPDFELQRPETLAEALGLLSEHGESAAFYMGGTELLLAMKYGFAHPSVLVDGKRLRELRATGADDDWLLLGAGMTHRQLETSPMLREALPELALVEATVANVRVRAAGTLGGNLCFAEPHSDPATLLIALGAEVELASMSGVRSVSMEDFVLGPLQTALRPGEVMTTIRIPRPAAGTRVAFERIRLRERPVANVAVALTAGGARVVVGAVGPRPVRITEAEDLLADHPDAIDEACALVGAGVRPYADSEGSIEYKRHLASVVTGRALRRAAA